MPDTYDNTNRGALFRNERKTKDEQPDHTGSLDVDGTEYWVSAWVKESKEGKRYFSLAVTPKEKRDIPPNKTPHAAIAGLDDDIPF